MPPPHPKAFSKRNQRVARTKESLFNTRLVFATYPSRNASALELAILVGQSISHYKILAKLGEGGMGVVYRAQDQKLERNVALKFLAAHLLNDDEAKERFLREAKAAAALHHPNICPVHEIDEDRGKTFLAMAFLEGEPLEGRIAAGPLPLKDVLEIGRQVAEGLSAAHVKSIVHRDVKPANILVSPDGRATIMDFGLARLTEASKLTRQDQTVGTAAYMSPEQIQGAEVDHRTDVWALGCVLYEMVAGVKPFKGEYDQALAYEIVHEEPEPLTGVRAGVPMELEFIVGKCLSKEPGDRPESAREVARDLRILSDKLKSGRSTVLRTKEHTSISPAVEPSATAADKDGARAAWIAMGVLAVVAIAGWASYLGGPPASPPRQLRLSVLPAPGTRLPLIGFQHAPMFSPDGSQLLLRTRTLSAFLRPLGSTDLTPLGSIGLHAAFSPDGRWMVRLALPSLALEKRRLPDGPWQRLADSGFARGLDWGSRSWILAASNDLRAVPEDGGEPVRALADSWEEIRWPQFLPNGEHFIFSGKRTGEDERGIYLARLGADGNADEPVLLLVNPGSARFSPIAGGHLFFVQGARLYAQKLNIASRRLEGEPQPVAEDVAWSPVYGLSYFDVAQDGTLAWRSGKSSQDRLTWFDREGRALETMGPPENFLAVSLSPNGQRAVARAWSGSGGRLLLESGQSGSRELDGRGGPYHWFGDSNTLITTVLKSREARVVEQATSPDAEQRTVAKLPRPTSVAGVSRDGRHFVLGFQRPFLLDLDEPDKLTPLGPKEEQIFNVGFSPDGEWVVYNSTAGQAYVQSLDLDSPRRQISRTGGGFPIWRRDGREILYYAGGKIMSVAVETKGGRFQAAEPVPLFDVELPPHRIPSSKPFDVTADGSRILIAVPEEQASSESIQIATGWQAGLQ